MKIHLTNNFSSIHKTQKATYSHPSSSNFLLMKLGEISFKARRRKQFVSFDEFIKSEIEDVLNKEQKINKNVSDQMSVDGDNFSNHSLQQAEKKALELKKIKKDLGKSLDLKTKKDVKNVLEYFGFSVKNSKKNLLSIDKYKQPSENFTFSDLGINENKFFEHIAYIKRDVDFSYSNVTDLGALEKIGGNADFRFSKIKSLGSLEKILKDANFSYSEVKDLGQLTKIGKNAHFVDLSMNDFGKLTHIGGSVWIVDCKISSLGNLQKIGADATISNSEIGDLGALSRIEKDANFYNTKLNSLGNLEIIGGDAFFVFSKVKNLGKLNTIGGSAIFNYSLIKDLSELEIIGKKADFRNSKITSLNKLKKIGGKAYLGDIKLSPNEIKNIEIGEIA